jgi:hypothetical protein
LDFHDRSFGSAELLQIEGSKSLKRDEMMKDFWLLLEESHPGAIPPGIIFLKGDRIKQRGFGWAPASWMSAQGADHPDPIALTSRPAKLEPEEGGLLVQYPGFLLHCENRKAILCTTDGEGFWFPSDNSLTEWYHAKWVDDGDSYSVQTGNVDKQSLGELAIILCRPRPGQIAEIALLVEIDKTVEQRVLGETHRKRVFSVYVLHRISVKRETSEQKLQESKAAIIRSQRPKALAMLEHETEPKDDTRIICGEALEEDQRWYVDCRFDSAHDKVGTPTILPPITVIASTAISKPLGFRGGPELVVPTVYERGTSIQTSENTLEESRISEQTSRTSVMGSALLDNTFQEPPMDEKDFLSREHADPREPREAGSRRTLSEITQNDGVATSKLDKFLRKMRRT